MRSVIHRWASYLFSSMFTSLYTNRASAPSGETCASETGAEGKMGMNL